MNNFLNIKCFQPIILLKKIDLTHSKHWNGSSLPDSNSPSYPIDIFWYIHSTFFGSTRSPTFLPNPIPRRMSTHSPFFDLATTALWFNIKITCTCMPPFYDRNSHIEMCLHKLIRGLYFKRWKKAIKSQKIFAPTIM